MLGRDGRLDPSHFSEIARAIRVALYPRSCSTSSAFGGAAEAPCGGGADTVFCRRVFYGGARTARLIDKQMGKTMAEIDPNEIIAAILTAGACTGGGFGNVTPQGVVENFVAIRREVRLQRERDAAAEKKANPESDYGPARGAYNPQR